MIANNAEVVTLEKQAVDAEQAADQITLSLADLDMVGGGGVTVVFG